MSLRLIAGFLAAFLLSHCLPSHACAPMPRDPKDVIMVADESAVIVWDSAKQTQHFIRSATFKGSKRDLGFIVPSPSVPELKEADQGVFDILKKALEPKVVYRDKYEYEWSLLDAMLPKGAMTTASRNFDTAGAPRGGGVEVLQAQSVAGYDATSLKASNSGELNRWLVKNGYIAKPDFASWLEPYTKKGWIVTAFKISKPDGASEAFSSSLVRMSFQTPKPFFPYREPSGQREGEAKNTFRALRVFFIGSERMEGTLGEEPERGWPGQARWSDDLKVHLEPAKLQNLAKGLALKPDQLPAQMRMTSFEDYSMPRPGFEDVYFRKSARQESILPPPIIRWNVHSVFIPLDVIFVVGVIVFVVGYKRMRRRGA